MTFVRKGVVIPLGVDGDFDDTHCHWPTVIDLDGRILVYYGGYDGSRYRVGLAVSDDGVHFTKQGVVLPLGVSPDFDYYHATSPGAIVLDGRVYLYYVGHGGSNYAVGLAISDDGVHFVKLGLVLPLGADGDFDDAHTYHAGAIVLDGRVYLYYLGNDGTLDRVGLAVSDDGVHFTKHGVVLPLGTDGEIDDRCTQGTAPVFYNGAVFLYYSAYDISYQRGALAIAADGVHFTKQGVVLPLGASGDFDDVRVHGPAAIDVGGRIHLYYMGSDGANYRIGLAISESGF